jgi:hypothetical protein
MLWMTRASGNVDRVAYPWLIKRFNHGDTRPRTSAYKMPEGEGGSRQSPARSRSSPSTITGSSSMSFRCTMPCTRCASARPWGRCGAPADRPH